MTPRAVSHAVSSSHGGDIQLFEVLIALRSDLHKVVAKEWRDDHHKVVKRE
jgi:hypothetical protein